MRYGARHRIEHQRNKQNNQQHDERFQDQPFVVLPDDVLERFERVHEPQERRVRATVRTKQRKNKKFELMLTGRAKAYSSSCTQTVNLSPAISSRLLRGYRSLMPSCADFLEPRKSRLGPSKSTFNAENFTRSLSLSISIGFGAIRSWNVSRSPKPKNP